jgi:hypothetical protein
LTTIIVATPNITLTIDTNAMYRVHKYRQQRSSLYMLEIGDNGTGDRENDKALMSNDEEVHSSFGLRHSFVIRALSFVIFLLRFRS